MCVYASFEEHKIKCFETRQGEAAKGRSCERQRRKARREKKEARKKERGERERKTV